MRKTAGGRLEVALTDGSRPQASLTANQLEELFRDFAFRKGSPQQPPALGGVRTPGAAQPEGGCRGMVRARDVAAPALRPGAVSWLGCEPGRTVLCDARRSAAPKGPFTVCGDALAAWADTR